MKLTFLGTGTSQGVPVIGMNTPVAHSKDKKDKRLRTSALLSWGGVNVNIDCSPDFRQQMLRHKVQHLEAILFTHEHADHTAGLDDIRPFVHKQGDMPIYARPRVIEQLRIRFAYIFATENRYAGAPSVKVFEVEDTTPFFLFGKEVIPIAVQHGILPILGYRIGNVAYITDAKIIEKEQLSTTKAILEALKAGKKSLVVTWEENGKTETYSYKHVRMIHAIRPLILVKQWDFIVLYKRSFLLMYS